MKRIRFSEITGKMRQIETAYLAKRGEWKTLKRRKKQYEKIALSDNEISDIDEFYLRSVGKRVPKEWHRLYKSYTGRFDARYLVDYFFSGYIEPAWNRREYAIALSDKNLQQTIFGNLPFIKMPKVFYKCVQGTFFDNNNKIISFDSTIEGLQNIGEVVIKQTVDTNSGRGVMIVNFHEGRDHVSGKSVKDIFALLPRDFIIQEKVKPNKQLADIYNGSINTFRVITYIWNDEINFTPIVLRIGRNGSFVDNVHAGGIMVGVHEDGTLCEYAYSVNGESFKKHPNSGVEFGKIKLAFISEMMTIASELHRVIPEMGIVSWDITVDENGNFVLLESNVYGQAMWISQIAHGVASFGDNTEGILRSIVHR